MKKLIMAVIGIFLATTSVATAKEGKLFRNPKKKVPVYKKVNIDEERLLVLRGRVDELSIRPLVKKMTELDKKSKKPIFLIINSPGGSVVDGFELIETMESIDSPLVCIVESEAYSMGALIATYCPTLYVHKFAMLMYHEASYGVEGSQSRIRTRVDMTERYLNQMFADVAAQLGLTPQEFKAKIHDEWWLTARESVASGLADGIINELKYTYEEPKKPAFPGFFFGGDGNGGLPSLPDIESETTFKAGDEVKVKAGFYRGCTGQVDFFIPTKKPPSEYGVVPLTCKRNNGSVTYQTVFVFTEDNLELVK